MRFGDVVEHLLDQKVVKALHVACIGEKRKAHRVMVGKSKGKSTL
jgi:hypothetical protein